MKRSRRLAAGVTTAAFSITLVGCAAKNEVAAPDGARLAPTTVLAHSLASQTGVANSIVASPPTVIVLDQNDAPMRNVEVSFAVTNGGGSVVPDLVRTDNNGFAAASWRLGDTSIENTLTATVSGIQPVIFRANSLLPQNAPAVRATRWDLLLAGGQQLPLTYSGGGATWTITGGHYVFLDDSTYTFGYDIDLVAHPNPSGRYFRLASGEVQFYLAPGTYGPFYAEMGGLFSTATIQGNLITVKYEDLVDFETEIYVMSTH
jgi:hypothetical protein